MKINQSLTISSYSFQLLSLANGKVALVLEGGYSMDALCDSAEQCSRALMGHPIEKISHDELSRPPCYNAVETLQKTVAIQSQYWTSLTGAGPMERVGLSHFQCWGRDKVGFSEEVFGPGLGGLNLYLLTYNVLK